MFWTKTEPDTIYKAASEGSRNTKVGDCFAVTKKNITETKDPKWIDKVNVYKKVGPEERDFALCKPPEV